MKTRCPLYETPLSTGNIAGSNTHWPGRASRVRSTSERGGEARLLQRSVLEEEKPKAQTPCRAPTIGTHGAPIAHMIGSRPVTGQSGIALGRQGQLYDSMMQRVVGIPDMRQDMPGSQCGLRGHHIPSAHLVRRDNALESYSNDISEVYRASHRVVRRKAQLISQQAMKPHNASSPVPCPKHPANKLHRCSFNMPSSIPCG